MVRRISAPFTHGLPRGGLVAIAIVLAAAAAPANPPAALQPPVEDRVRASFARFAERWLTRARVQEEEARRNPSVRPGAAGPRVSYRGYGDAYEIELRPTGRPGAPYLGVLHYTERIYQCESLEAERCTVVSRIPVSEIFRFRDGRWGY